MSQVIAFRSDHPGHSFAARGYSIIYRQDQPNFCPGCGRSHWYVGA